MFMALGGFPLKRCLELEDSLQGWMGGLVCEKASLGTSKVNSKVGQGKRPKP
jgi:hypothetical protein